MNKNIVSLFCLMPKEISEKLEISPSFRGKQIYKNIISGATSFSEMSDLPKDLRLTLDKEFSIFSSKVIKEQRSSDGTNKIALKLYDGNIVESVLLLSKSGRKTACLSTQVGCAMACQFCNTATLGFKRNLYDYEIVEQFAHLNNLYGKINNIVFMGMGEPFLNTKNLFSAIEFLNLEDSYNIGKRKITISTCGVVSGIDEFIESDIDVKLAISLNSADEDKRKKLMPVTNKFSLSDLKASLVRYQKSMKHRITFEYVLIKNFNDSIEDIKKLAKFCKGLTVMVNLIPWNRVEGLSYESPSKSDVISFIKTAEKFNINITKRVSKGQDIDGACGQLAAKSIK